MKVGDEARSDEFFSEHTGEIAEIDNQPLWVMVTLQYGKECDFAKITINSEMVKVVKKTKKK